MPIVTVIITTYNRAGSISEAVDSVLAQTFTDFELLVVDNGSTDNTREVIGRFKDDRVKYIYNETPSGSCAMPRNIGARTAAGQYIAFLDDDDIWYPKKLEICVERLNDDRGAVLVCHSNNVVKDGKKILERRFGPWSEDMYERLIYDGNFLAPTAVVIRKQTLLDLGGFSTDEKYLSCDDYEFWIRLAGTGARFHFIDEALGEFRITGNNASIGDYKFSLRVAELIRDAIILNEQGAVSSARAKRRMTGMYLSVLRALLIRGKYAEAVGCYGKILRLGSTGVGIVVKKVARNLGFSRQEGVIWTK